MKRAFEFWRYGTFVQRLTVLVAIAATVSLPGFITRTERAQFDCKSDVTGLPTVIVYEASRTASAIAKRYCTGDIAAAEAFLEERHGDGPLMLGGIIRFPVNKP